MSTVKLLTTRDKNLFESNEDTSSRTAVESGYSGSDKSRVFETALQSVDEPPHPKYVLEVQQVARDAPTDSHLASSSKISAVIKEQDTYAHTQGPFRHGNEIPDYFKAHSEEMYAKIVGEQAKLASLVKKYVVETTTSLDAIRMTQGEMKTLINGLSNSSYLQGPATHLEEELFTTATKGSTFGDPTLHDAMHQSLRGADPPFHDRSVRTSRKPDNAEGLYRGTDPNRNQGQKYVLF